eukprot:SAG22_NODE_10231_length_546_cov_0.926174_1_plen_58_part_10
MTNKQSPGIQTTVRTEQQLPECGAGLRPGPPGRDDGRELRQQVEPLEGDRPAVDQDGH